MSSSTGRRGIPLAAMVTTVVVVLVVGAAGSVGVSAYYSSRASVDGLWKELATNIAARTTREALRFLEPAVPQAHVAHGLVASGRLDIDRPLEMLEYLELVIKANPQLTWASWGDERGWYMSVYRWPTDESGGFVLRRTFRRQLVVGPMVVRDGKLAHPALFLDWQQEPDGRWRQRPTRVLFYDPRHRPWYRAVATNPPGEGRWVDPFFMQSRLQTGVAFAYPSHLPSGALRGVFAMEIEAGPLSAFLATVRVGERGRVYIIDRKGAVIGHPAGEVTTVTPSGDKVLANAAEHADPMLSVAWSEVLRRTGEERWQPFELDEYLAMATPFPAESHIPWRILTVVPADDFFGEVRAEGRKAVLIGAGVLALAVILALYFSRSLSRSVRLLQAEMERIAHFELGEDRMAELPTVVREIGDMGAATDNMKQGLRSFGKYVPHQLVNHLLRSGQEAKLGGELREMTVLFADIADFTTIAEALGPNALVLALGDYLEAMNKAIRGADGTVCQYLGDAIMAFWGAPEPYEDHALRACLGGLAMRAAGRALQDDFRKRGRPELRTRFGINSGEVMVGNIGAPERFNYAILGDPVNTAARLEGLNKVYKTQLLIGERTAELVGDGLVTRPIDWVRMKGKVKPMLVHELVGRPEDVGDATRAGLAAYAAALREYRAQRWDEAVRGFREAAAQLDGDVASEVLAARCRGYREAPPPEDWDGVHVMTTK